MLSRPSYNHIAEILSALTNKLMVRVIDYFETQIHAPASKKRMSDEQIVSWFGKVLEGVRLRYRKLQRFSRYVWRICLERVFTI